MPVLPDQPRPSAVRRALYAANLPPDRWRVALLLAVTGPGALAGDAFRNGVEMAVQGINGAGGLLGRLVEISTFNTASSPEAARTTLHRALEHAPLALLGPVAPAETEAVAPLSRERGLLQIAVSTDGPPPPGQPLLLLTSPTAAARMAMLARWLASDLRVERVALLSTATHGPIAARLATACRAATVQVVADVSLPQPPHGPAQNQATELSGLLTYIEAARPQALFIGARGTLAARILRAARQQLPEVALFGTADLLAPAVLEAAGDAGLGLRAFANLTPDAPVGPLEDFRSSYLSQYHAEPDALAMQGYIALSMVQAAVQMLAPATPSGPALAAALRAAPLPAVTTPGILLDTRWDAAGQPHRVGFVAEVLPASGLGWSVVAPVQG
jgi:ABC-type branched-subunit amino acid transport system substrate-binding protein